MCHKLFLDVLKLPEVSFLSLNFQDELLTLELVTLLLDFDAQFFQLCFHQFRLPHALLDFF